MSRGRRRGALAAVAVATALAGCPGNCAPPASEEKVQRTPERVARGAYVARLGDE